MCVARLGLAPASNWGVASSWILHAADVPADLMTPRSVQPGGVPMSSTVAELAGPYSQAWAAHDPAAIVALHTSDSVFHAHGLGEPAVGTESVRQLVETFLAVVPDLHFEPKRFHAGADHLVYEYDMSGTAGDSSFVCDGVDIIVFADGLVARKDTYLDLAALERQLGGLPVMNSA
jgi:ketosteroid isomerase-like protein